MVPYGDCTTQHRARTYSTMRRDYEARVPITLEGYSAKYFLARPPSDFRVSGGLSCQITLFLKADIALCIPAILLGARSYLLLEPPVTFPVY